MQKLKSSKTNKPKVIILVGPTASGKSALAVKIALQLRSGPSAKKINPPAGGEIISADSRQVYKDLDIGTGKITTKEMKGIPHYLLDVVNPKKRFTVVEYKKLAEKKLKEIVSKGKIPIICGGTGFYIDAVVRGIVLPPVPPNPKLRKELGLNSSTENFKILQKLDKRRAKEIEKQNAKNNNIRIIRAIEIAQALGKVPKMRKTKPKYDFIKIGLTLPLPELEKKIKKRVKKMFDKKNDGGLLKEIENLKKSGISEKRLKEFGFEYDNPTPESVILGSVQYAKRQMTWFKRDKEIIWISPPVSASENAELLGLVKSLLQNK